MTERINKLINKILGKLHLLRFKEQIMYLIVGGLTTVIDWAVFALLKELIPPLDGSFALFELSPYIIQYTVAWSAAVLFAYFASKYFVFEYGHGDDGKRFIEFVISRLLTLGISILFDVVLTGDAVGICMNAYLVKAISSVVVIIVNYVTNKWIVFNKKRKSKPAGEPDAGESEDGKND